jgi:hypothetical protein
MLAIFGMSGQIEMLLIFCFMALVPVVMLTLIAWCFPKPFSKNLVHCTDCEIAVPSSTPACPQCGCRLE